MRKKLDSEKTKSIEISLTPGDYDRLNALAQLEFKGNRSGAIKKALELLEQSLFVKKLFVINPER